MTIQISQHLQCQALLAMRYALDAEGISRDMTDLSRVRHGDNPQELIYQIMPTDPIPEGLSVGEFLYGFLAEMDKGLYLPILVSWGS